MNRNRDIILVFLISFLMCVLFIWAYPIYILDESKNAEAAREMLFNNNYSVPFFNGVLRTDKPPLHYFFMVLGYKLFGVNALGARFFSSVFGALTFLVMYTNAAKYSSKEAAFVTIAVVLSSVFFVQEFHLAVPDPYLIFFISFSLFSFFNFHKSHRKKWLWFMYSAMGLGMLTKGPVAIALPGLSMLLFLLLKRDLSLKNIWGYKPVHGLLLIILIAFPWYYLVHVKTGGAWTRGFFLDHNINRFSQEKEGHGGIFLMTILYVILGLLPFSVFSIQAFRNGWKKRKENDFLLFCFTVSVVIIGFFSISGTKLPNYTMPAYPFLAILLGVYLHNIYVQKKYHNTVKWSLIVLLIISLVVPVGAYVALTLEKQFLSVRYVSYFLFMVTIAVSAGCIFFWKNDLRRAFLSIASGWVILAIVLFGYIYPVLTQKSPVVQASDHLNTTATIVAYKSFDSAFPINFNRTFEVYNSLQEIDTFLNENPDAFVISNHRKREDLLSLSTIEVVLEQKALFENHTTLIIRKKR